jgi:hypothetical protein
MWHANVWDWFSTSLMMVGFSILLGLGAYLVLCLVSAVGGDAPDDIFEEQPVRDDLYYDELRWLAS